MGRQPVGMDELVEHWIGKVSVQAVSLRTIHIYGTYTP
jgi:hypothetical protein